MDWFAYSLLAAVSMSGYMISTRILLKDKGDSLVFTFITSAAGALALFLILPFEKIKLPAGWVILPILTFLGLFYGLVDAVFARARQLEEVSKVSVAIQSAHFWNLIGAFLIFHELIGPQKLFGVALIVLANILIIWKRQKMELSRGILLTLLGTFLYIFAAYADKILVVRFSPVFYKAVLFAIESVWLFLLLGPLAVQKSVKEFKLQGWAIATPGPFIALANYFLVRAFQLGGEASKALPVFGLSLIFSTLTGIIFLGEKEDLFKKLLAVAVSFVGAYLINTG